MLVIAVDRPDIPGFSMPNRFRTDVAYFMTPAQELPELKLATGEYWVKLSDAQRWLSEGVLEVVSPLDSLNHTEFEITEEQEAWLTWMVEHGIERIRIQD
jgi:hypothetical protein